MKMPLWAAQPRSKARGVGGGLSVLLKDTSAGRMLGDTEVLNPDLCGWGAVDALTGSWFQLIRDFRVRKTQIREGKFLNGAAEEVGPQEPCHCSPVTSGPVFTPSF